jgi:hypothetical protein
VTSTFKHFLKETTMTASTTIATSANTAPVRIDLAIPDVFPALLKVSETIAAQGLDKNFST